MKKNLIIALIVLLVAGLFISCDGTVNAALAGGSKDSYITFEGTGKFTLLVLDDDDYYSVGLYDDNGELVSSGVLEFSSDASTWQDVKSLTAEDYEGSGMFYKLNSSEDGKLYLRGKGNNVVYCEKYLVSDDADLSMSVSGNIMTLLDYENPDSATMGFKVDEGKGGDFSGCFEFFFGGNVYLTDASKLELPAKTLEKACYDSMFIDCRNLKHAPALPATSLVQDCYKNMFTSCKSLEKAPELPATTLAQRCYYEMFVDCTSLTKSPELPATTLAQGCYYGMFEDCTSLTKSPELPATTLAQVCYYAMFEGCENLVEVGEIKATTMATDILEVGEITPDGCCGSMFKFCDSLKITTTGGTKCFTCPNEVSTAGYEKAVENMFGSSASDESVRTPVAGNTYYWTN